MIKVFWKHKVCVVSCQGCFASFPLTLPYWCTSSCSFGWIVTLRFPLDTSKNVGTKLQSCYLSMFLSCAQATVKDCRLLKVHKILYKGSCILDSKCLSCALDHCYWVFILSRYPTGTLSYSGGYMVTRGRCAILMEFTSLQWYD